MEKGVLWPGDPECSAKYREKIYYFADEAAREKFLATPDAFLPKDRPPLVCYSVIVRSLWWSCYPVMMVQSEFEAYNLES